MVQLFHEMRVAMGRGRALHRRDLLRGFSAASLAGGVLNFSDLMSASAAELRKEGMSCILLWMQGGPSQFETFSPKPAHANGGETRAISTAVPGIKVSENFPLLAREMRDVAIIRSMTSKEGSHRRAAYLLHTGALPTPTVKYPTLGSILSHEIGHPDCELPSFVQLGTGRGGANGGARAGYFGVQHDPFVIATADKRPENTTPATTSPRFRRRLGLLDRLEVDYAAAGGKELVADHQKLYSQAARMILSSDMRAFDLADEPAALRQAYGENSFGTGCLLARRLIQTGVTCVEVSLGNWDTHFDNFARSQALSEQVDRGMSQLLSDLRSRGMLERTLVIWMGEFGRTPRINPRGGRDHYPRAFNVALAGGGIRGGQVIGSTDAGGVSIEDRPVTVPDLFRTICTSLRLDPDKEHISPIGRPIKIVDGGTVVEELLG